MSPLDPSLAEAPATLLLDVGQGDASLILLPGAPRRAIVVDCKDDQVVGRHLTDFGVEQLVAVVFTHLDLDHICGGLALLQAWERRIGAVYLNIDGRALGEDTGKNTHAKTLLDAAIDMAKPNDPSGFELRTPERGVQLAAGLGWRVRLLAPFHADALREARGATPRSPNARSAVVRVERDTQNGQSAVLIGGDASLHTWSRLPPEELQATVFRTPHHGGGLADDASTSGWSVERLVEQAGPTTAVVSVGSPNGHGHPSAAWQEALGQRPGCAVYCTQVTPACHPAITHDRQAEALRRIVLGMRGQAEPAWRHLTTTGRPRGGSAFAEVPCAGTVSVGLDDVGGAVVRPTRDDHQRVVHLWQRPWCISTPADLVDDPLADL